MGENISAILQRKLLPTCKDLGTFPVPCKIGNIGIGKAMCDLGASINVMPIAIYESLDVGPLKEMGVVLQLADRSIVYPEGVLEDVLMQVNELVFSADFYVLDMMGDNSPNYTSILLGKPFLKTFKTKIDVDARILSMEFDNEVVSNPNPPPSQSSPLHVAMPSLPHQLSPSHNRLTKSLFGYFCLRFMKLGTQFLNFLIFISFHRGRAKG
ncbi:UNVERIFIED_CONTAM: hypothetical protein Scaly_0069600 [Sesamum calycinum]|uniref:Aspartic peptidase DDI1-type domain-containing protein n=1 Tax=Sesamum calycinum TaxID=2727403 RepID=A0AAW2SUY5_9LAMI